MKVGSVKNEFDLSMSKISSKNIKRLSVPQSPVVLAILDGWGYRKEKSDNAIKSAHTPIMDSLWHAYPHTLISVWGYACHNESMIGVLALFIALSDKSSLYPHPSRIARTTGLWGTLNLFIFLLLMFDIFRSDSILSDPSLNLAINTTL